MAATSRDDLDTYLAASRRLVDDALGSAVPGPGTPPPVLHEAMRHTLLLPGKRLRGILVLAACEACKGDPAAALPLACAAEMVHAASLILDDLPSMDNATLRRGKPALHRVVGEANAILAAVALLGAAFETARRAEALKERARGEAVSCLALAVGSEGMTAGQVLDLEASGRRLDLEALESMYAGKTAALFVAAARLGGIAAGAKARDLEALERYARSLGLAFQITDDLLDYSGNPATTGKDGGLDRERTTFVNLLGIDGARRLVDERIDGAIAALKPLGRRSARLAAFAAHVRDRER